MIRRYPYADPLTRRRGARSAHRKAAARQALPARQVLGIAAARERAVATAMRCIRALLVRLGRDYERCGKAACLRARRCCGTACEPDATNRHLLS
jgi:hypothetical protein